MRSAIARGCGHALLAVVAALLLVRPTMAQTEARLLRADDSSVAKGLQPTPADRAPAKDPQPTPAVRPQPTPAAPPESASVEGRNAKKESQEETKNEGQKENASSLSVVAPDESPSPTPAKRPRPAPAASTAAKDVPGEASVEPPGDAVSGDPSEEPIKPIPDPLQVDQIEIEAAGFSGIVPGTSTLDTLKESWGEPKESREHGNTLLQLYSIEPFNRIEVTSNKGTVTSIVVRLDQKLPAKELAERLQLGRIRPATVLSESGEVLGQVYPERGVLFSFAPNESPDADAAPVAQIILEPIDAEPFVLRAERTLESDPAKSLRDVQTALKLNKDNARAHWLYSRHMAAQASFDKAILASTQAAWLEPRNPEYRIARAQALGHVGRLNEAVQEAKKAVAMSESRPHLKARSLCLAGDLLASGAVPNYSAAIKYHIEAVKTADPIAADANPPIRRVAKEVLLDAHLGAAHDIAWGNWKEKDTAVDRWLSRADRLAEDLVENEKATEEHRFRLATRALAACVGVRGGIDPTRWTEGAIRSGRQLLALCDDPHHKAQLEWDLGMALYDALQTYQMRKDHAAALKYGQQAVEYLTMADRERHTPTAGYLLGRLYFRLGAIHAARGDSRQEAIAWFDKAVPLLEKPVPDEALPDLGRHGETFVSMAVSYWEAGQRDKAIALTRSGVKIMQRAVTLGYLDNAALSVAYNNLASMHRQIGRDREAGEFEQMATKAGGDTKLR